MYGRDVRTAQARRERLVMSKALVLSAAALAFSAASASAQVYTTTATQNRSLIWRHLPMGTQRRPHRRTRHRRSMQPRFIHHRQSTWCQLPSTQLQWCRAITQRPWFRSQYMPTPRGIGVATGMGGAATASSQYMPTPRGIGVVATGMGGAATATGMGGAKHLIRNDTGAELVAT
jgi:hypothetical protein